MCTLAIENLYTYTIYIHISIICKIHSCKFHNQFYLIITTSSSNSLLGES